eukprot:6456036-Amphidinium_carterae.3
MQGHLYRYGCRLGAVHRLPLECRSPRPRATCWSHGSWIITHGESTGVSEPDHAYRNPSFVHVQVKGVPPLALDAGLTKPSSEGRGKREGDLLVNLRQPHRQIEV